MNGTGSVSKRTSSGVDNDNVPLKIELPCLISFLAFKKRTFHQNIFNCYSVSYIYIWHVASVVVGYTEV